MYIHLSEPHAWTSRSNVPNAAGVYVISKAGEVVYIGRTWGTEGLRGRLAAFHCSAKSGQKGHAGGVTFNGRFIVVAEEELSVRVHVPVIVRREPEILNSYIQYVERRLIWEFVEQYGRLPACNSE